MGHPIQQCTDFIRRRTRWMTAARGLARTVVVTVIALVAIGLTDYLIRFRDPGIRILATLIVALSVGWSLFHFFIRVLSRPLRDVELARRIELRFPELGERLSSAVQFVRQPEDDPRDGSSGLRRAVIADATARLQPLDLNAVFDWHATRRALVAAAVAGMLVVALIVMDATSVRVALSRLVSPLGGRPWPRTNELAFRNPVNRLAVGQPFEVELIDRRGRLPERVRIVYRYEVDGQVSEETELMRYSDGIMIAEKQGVTRPFSYRAVGGDDDTMDWIKLDVMEPPLVEAFNVTLYPPGYSGYPPERSDKRIRALVGTRVSLAGTCTKRITEARLMLETGEQIAAKVSDDGYEFSVSPDNFSVRESTQYWFELVDDQQLVGGSEIRWAIVAIPDLPPSVRIEQPDATIYVTPRAVLPLRVLAKDNLRVRDVSIHYIRSDHSEQGDQVLPLYQGPPTAVANEGEIGGALAAGDTRLVETPWELGPLKVAPGVQIAMLAHASDYQPKIGQSAAPHRILVVTPGELEDRLAQRQQMILNELARVLTMQRDVHTQSSGIEVQLTTVRQISKTDLEQLQAAEINQRQVVRTLTSDVDGIPRLVVALLADINNNRIDSPDVTRRMQNVLSEINRLGDGPLPAINRDLTSAIKSGQRQLEPQENSLVGGVESVVEPLSEAIAAQNNVVHTLERLLGELANWADYRGIAREIRQIQLNQTTLLSDTKMAAVGTLTRDVKDLDASQRAELEKLSLRQLQLARQFEKVLQGMEAMGARFAEVDPLVAATLDDGLHQARSGMLGGKMREAGRQLQENLVGQATGTQESVAEGLRQLLDTLANRREHELGRLVTKLREAERDLEKLRSQQRGLRKKMEQAAEQPDGTQRRQQLQRLLRQQREIQKNVERMARRLKRLQADRAGRSAQRSATRLAGAGDAAEQGDGAGAAGESRAGEKDLEQAQQEIAAARQRAEEDLAREQLAQFEDNVRGFRDRQKAAFDETVRLDGVRITQGRLTREQLVSLQNVSSQQSALAEDVRAAAEQLSQAKIFSAVLSGVADAMDGAAQLLARRRAGQDVQKIQTDVLTRLQSILQAISGTDEKRNNDGQGGGSGGGQQGGGGGHDVAELKLVKFLQVEINRRTTWLQQQRARSSLTAEQRVELRRLSDEQRQLADLVYNLLDSADDSGGEPLDLPEFDLGGESIDLGPLPEFQVQ